MPAKMFDALRLPTNTINIITWFQRADDSINIPGSAADPLNWKYFSRTECLKLGTWSQE
jgi:hypothetical protein